jgi:hypothetical protein
MLRGTTQLSNLDGDSMAIDFEAFMLPTGKLVDDVDWEIGAAFWRVSSVKTMSTPPKTWTGTVHK